MSVVWAEMLAVVYFGNFVRKFEAYGAISNVMVEYLQSLFDGYPKFPMVKYLKKLVIA